MSGPTVPLLTALLSLAGAGPLAPAPVPAQAPSGPATALQQVYVVFRHGARTPVDTYPADPHVNFTFPPVGWGQLTNAGKMQQFQAGEFLRRRYGGLLQLDARPRPPLPLLLRARSTDTDRALMSAQLQLAGLWRPPPPPASGPRPAWPPPGLLWEPVAVHTVPVPDDRLLLGPSPCPGYYQRRDRVLASEQVKQQLEQLGAAQLYLQLNNITWLNISSPDDVQSLYSTLKAEEEYGLSLPEFIKEYYPEELVEITALSFVYNAYTKDLQKIKGGSLIKEIRDEMAKKIDGTLRPLERKMYMYSGHDSTVANLLISLGAWDVQIPNYGIMALIELHKREDDDEYGVKVFLRNSTEHEPYPLTMQGCAHFCPFTQFQELTQDVVNSNIEELCAVTDSTYVPPSDTPL